MQNRGVRNFLMKRGQKLKRFLGSILFIISFLVCSIITNQLIIDSREAIEIISFFMHILRVVLSLCGIILTYNNMKTPINNKANFMAICSLGIGVFLILQLRIYLVTFYGYGYIINNVRCRWFIEFLQLIMLIGCMNYIDEHTRMTKCFTIILAITVVGGILLLMKPYAWYLLDNERQIKQFVAVVYLLCLLLTSLCFVVSYNKIKMLDHQEKQIMISLFIVKLWTLVVVICRVRKDQLVLQAIESCLQISFELLVFIYINKMTLAVTWKKVDVGVASKKEEVIKGDVEQKMLVAAAREIQKAIGVINNKTLELETTLSAWNRKKDLNYIDKIKNNCHRLQRLSDNILDLNQYEAGCSSAKFESINLSTLLGGMVESVEPYVRQHGIDIQYTASNPYIIADIDREAIERLFLNLVSNAVKYNKESGKIQVILSKKKHKVFLCVKDTGIGIPPHYLELIFEKFQRVESRLTQVQEGSGLGLSIVKSLVDLHYGEIKIISQEGKGTLISIGLPIKQESDRETIRDYVKVRHLDEKIKMEFSHLNR